MTKRTMVSVLSMLAAVSACGTGTATQSVPSTPPSQQASGSASDSIANPIDLKKYQSNTCSMLAKSDYSLTGSTGPGKPDTDATGPTCAFDPTDLSLPSISVGVDEGKSGGINGLLQERGGQLGYVKEISRIDGYRAVAFSVKPNGPTSGTCAVAVATSKDNWMVNVGADGSAPKPDACELAQKVATAVVKNIKSGG